MIIDQLYYILRVVEIQYKIKREPIPQPIPIHPRQKYRLTDSYQISQIFEAKVIKAILTRKKVKLLQ